MELEAHLELVLPAVIAAVVLIVAFSAYRMSTLHRGMRAYTDAQELVAKGAHTVAERQRLEDLRARSVAAWGPTMDPTLTPHERLALLGPRDQWIVQNIDGTEDPEQLRLFTELVLRFLQKYEKGYRPQQFGDEVTLPFAQGLAGAEYRRLVSKGQDEQTASTRAREHSAKVTAKYLSSRTNPDGTWAMIEPPRRASR